VNKARLIDKIADDAGLTKNSAAEALESLVEAISEALRRDQRVTLSGFGSWTVSERRARAGRNPRTGEKIRIGAKKTVRFRPGKQLESDLNR
jgi:DNA-binding protein HU-beta